MSQPPSKPHGKPGPGGSWTPRPNVSGQYRPPSPYSPTGSPHPQRARGPPTPVHHAHPASPLTYTGMRHPMSPVPIGMPISPGISPVFGSPTGYIQCPRPRWPSPIPVASQVPRPFIPMQSSLESGATPPLVGGPPEYMIGTYRPGEYEYVGVPLDHSQTEEESSGPSTAEIIANQSQDYVDEKLAEYQATIQQLQTALYIYDETYQRGLGRIPRAETSSSRLKPLDFVSHSETQRNSQRTRFPQGTAPIQKSKNVSQRVSDAGYRGYQDSAKEYV